MLISSLFMLLLSNGLTVRNDVSILYSRVSLFTLTFCILCCITCYFITYIEKGIGLYNGLFISTGISNTFQTFIFISSSIILLLTGFYPRKLSGYATVEKKINLLKSLIINKMAEQYTIIEYALIILFVVIGGSLLLSSGDFISFFLCLELQSYGLYILTVIYRNSKPATSAGLTYFLLGALASCLILWGIAFIYSGGGIFNLDSFYALANLTTNNKQSFWYTPEYIIYSLLIISVGLLFKIGAAPFHIWTPDVYDGMPTIVTTFVATMAKIPILIWMLDLVHYTSDSLTKTIFVWTTSILISCLLSLIVGTVLGLSQVRIKRLIAYSTVSHVGFILLALGVNNIESSKAFIFYLMQYTITNINTFIILITIGYSLYLYGNKNSVFSLKDKNNSPVQLIRQLKGYFYVNPLLALCLTIVMLSFAGLPPLVGFFAKQMILSSALDNGFVFLVLIAVITSVIGAVYYLGVIKTMFFDKSDSTESTLKGTLSNSLSVSISIITLMLLLFILIPNESLNLSNNLSIISFTDNINL